MEYTENDYFFCLNTEIDGIWKTTEESPSELSVHFPI